MAPHIEFYLEMGNVLFLFNLKDLVWECTLWY